MRLIATFRKLLIIKNKFFVNFFIKKLLNIYTFYDKISKLGILYNGRSVNFEQKRF